MVYVTRRSLDLDVRNSSLKAYREMRNVKHPSWTPSSVELTDMWRLCECLHFSCHGRFNFDEPLDSFLMLARHKPLRVRDVLGLRLPNCKLCVCMYGWERERECVCV